MKSETTIKELKLHSRAKKKSPEKVNNERTSYLTDDMVSENWQLLEVCRQHYDKLADFRDRRRRARKYLRGDQWHELVEDEEGNTITEEAYIKTLGKIPFKQNVIRQLLRSILGQYRTNRSKTYVKARTQEVNNISDMLTNTLQSAQLNNATQELDARNAEEFFLSGAAISKTTYTWIKERNIEDAFDQNVNPNRIFFNTDISDIRLTDLRLIGEIKDVPIDKVITAFARNEADEAKIRSWYSNVDPRDIILTHDGLSADRMDNLDFYIPSDPGKVRVIEVWELVSDWRTRVHDYLDGTYFISKKPVSYFDEINKQRIALGAENGMTPEEIPLIDTVRMNDEFWVVKYLTPYGQCLFQSETMYKHEEHPYTLTLYPLIDGEVWGLVEDVIDQQRSINRMVSLIDFMIGNASKGVLMVHESSIPADMDIDDFADEWTKYNGVIKFTGKPGVPIPQQVTANITNIGAHEMLSMQMKMIQDIAGVSNAIQGKEAKSGTPSSLYAQEALNSTINTRDMFDVYAWHRRRRDTKMLKIIQQFYDEPRYVATSGNSFKKDAAYYKPDVAGNTDFDLVLVEGVDSPVYKQIVDDQLKELLQMNAITVKMYLENSSLPYAEKLLEQLNTQEQQMQQGGAMNLPAELQQEIAGNADPKAMNMLSQYMSGKN